MEKLNHIFVYFSIIILFASLMTNEVLANTEEDTKEGIDTSFKNAKDHFMKGEYKQAIRIYDSILETNPNQELALKMKGIGLNTMEDYVNSLKQFYKILQYNPNDVVALTGMGIGFGNLGEYEEALRYLDKAEIQEPDNKTIQNYKKLIEVTIHKYPYTSTEKPIDNRNQKNGEVPSWVKNTVEWWSLTKINDEDFLESLEYLIENDVIVITEKQSTTNNNELKMMSVIRTDLNTWSQNQSSDKEFFENIHWLIDNNLINADIKKIEKTQEDKDYEVFLFNKYLRNVVKNINDEKRYIEYSNPSQDVIKKFLRNYAKWNFEDQVKISSQQFPDPRYTIDDEKAYNVIYKIYINEQPPALPIDHKITLNNSFQFWENSELKFNGEAGKIKFEITTSKPEANVWITWVVRDMGEGVLGHAHVGKGVVEVALGDYSCDGSFQLFDVKSVETIMTHELGHSIGLLHTNDNTNIMYPSFTPSYAYCLLTR